MSHHPRRHPQPAVDRQVLQRLVHLAQLKLVVRQVLNLHWGYGLVSSSQELATTHPNYALRVPALRFPMVGDVVGVPCPLPASVQRLLGHAMPWQ